MGDFHHYFEGKLEAPFLTLFIGGNHEASVYLRDLYYGGWCAKNIFYLGSSGVITVKKGDQTLRIASLSGIDKDYHYTKGYFESPPYTFKDYRSMYHFREFDVQKLC